MIIKNIIWSLPARWMQWFEFFFKKIFTFTFQRLFLYPMKLKYIAIFLFLFNLFYLHGQIAKRTGSRLESGDHRCSRTLWGISLYFCPPDYLAAFWANLWTFWGAHPFASRPGDLACILATRCQHRFCWLAGLWWNRHHGVSRARALGGSRQSTRSGL